MIAATNCRFCSDFSTNPTLWICFPGPKDRIAKWLVQCVALPSRKWVEVCSHKISIFAPISYPIPYTPQKNGWNLKITPCKRKVIWTKPPLLGSMLIFRGVIHGKAFVAQIKNHWSKKNNKHPEKSQVLFKDNIPKSDLCVSFLLYNEMTCPV